MHCTINQIHGWSYVSENKLMLAFSSTRFLAVRFAIYPTAKVTELTNRNMPARNTLVQLLCNNPESHNAQCHKQTDRRQDYANSRSHCVAVRSAKNA